MQALLWRQTPPPRFWRAVAVCTGCACVVLLGGGDSVGNGDHPQFGPRRCNGDAVSAQRLITDPDISSGGVQTTHDMQTVQGSAALRKFNVLHAFAHYRNHEMLSVGSGVAKAATGSAIAFAGTLSLAAFTLGVEHTRGLVGEEAVMWAGYAMQVRAGRLPTVQMTVHMCA